MADQWWAVAGAVAGALEQAVGTLEDAVRLIDPAIAKFQAQAGLLRAIRDGATPEEAAARYVDPDPAGVRPTALLEGARLDIKRRRSLHGLARGLPLCAHALGLAPDADTSQRWERCNVAALTYARDAQMRLRNAASFHMAARDAIDLASELPFEAPLCLAWMGAAEQLTRLAVMEAALARYNMVMMRQAVGMQSLVAMDILGPALGALGGGINNQVDHQ